jgi:putative transposase
MVTDSKGEINPRVPRAILRAPPRTPQANSLCERVIGTPRGECLDFLIPLTEKQLRDILKQWVAHYTRGRSHTGPGPGIPYPTTDLPVAPHEHRHRIPGNLKVVARPGLSGLHHEYGLVPKAARIIAGHSYPSGWIRLDDG